MNRLLGDLVKHEPMDRHFRPQYLAEVPTDGLSLAVFIGGQIEFRGVFQQTFEFSDLLALRSGDDVDRLEIMVDVDAQIGPVFLFVLFGYFLGPLRQIADVADAGLDRIGAAEELADRSGFGRRFDDHQGGSAGGAGFFGHVIPLFVIPGKLGRCGIVARTAVPTIHANWHCICAQPI